MIYSFHEVMFIYKLQELGWDGLLQGSLFKKPKGNVLVTVITSEDQPVLELNNLAKFPLDMVYI